MLCGCCLTLTQCWQLAVTAKTMPLCCFCYLQFHGIRNDQHGARGDYIFVADAADYAEKTKRLMRLQQTPKAPQQQQALRLLHPLPPLPPLQQQPPEQDIVRQACGISLSSALSAAFTLRVRVDRMPTFERMPWPFKPCSQ